MECNEIEKCLVKCTDKKKTLKDKKGGASKLLIENSKNQEYCLIDFENCVYQNKQNDTKCDFGIKTEKEIFFIELKGSDVKQGIVQLKKTIEETKKCFHSLNFKGRLVVTKFQKPNVVKQSKDYIDLMKLVQQDFIIKQNIHIENV